MDCQADSRPLPLSPRRGARASTHRAPQHIPIVAAAPAFCYSIKNGGLVRMRILSFIVLFAVPVVGATSGAGAPQKLHHGSVFRDCKDCPELVVVPAGGFNMG